MTQTAPSPTAEATRQLIPFQAWAELAFQGGQYRAILELEAEVLLPDVSCSKCGHTTRQFLARRDITLHDDSDTAIMEAAASDDPAMQASVLEPTIVYALRKVSLSELTDLSGPFTVDLEEDELAQQIEQLAQGVLIDHVVCDGCLFQPGDNYLSKLLGGN